MSKDKDNKGNFFSQVKYEMSQVNFPGGGELRKNTGAIIVVIIFFAIFFFGADELIRLILNFL